MKALISPNEPRGDAVRVAEVCASEFPVAEPLYWKDCPDYVVADSYVYYPSSNEFVQVRNPEEDPEVL
jgi:hypothetical protein